MTFLKEGHSASAALYDAATVKTTPRVKGDVFPDPSLFVLMPPQWWKPDRQSGRHILDSGEVSALKAGAVRTDWERVLRGTCRWLHKLLLMSGAEGRLFSVVSGDILHSGIRACDCLQPPRNNPDTLRLENHCSVVSSLLGTWPHWGKNCPIHGKQDW